MLGVQLVLAWFAHYPATLSAWASQYLDTPVQLGHFSAEWSAWGPVLGAESIQIGTGKAAIQIASMTLAFSATGPRLALQSPKLTLAKTPNGWQILGLPPRQHQTRNEFIQQLSVRDATIQWATDSLPTLHLSRLTLLRNATDTQVAVDIQHPLGPAHLRADIRPHKSVIHAQLPGLAEYPIFATYQPDPIKPSIQLSAPELPLEPLTALLVDIPALADWHAQLPKLSGTFQSIQATGYPNQPDDWHIQGQINQLAIQAGQHHPGINQVQAELDIVPHQITAKIQATDALFSYPYLFRAPLTITQLSTTLQGQRADDGTWQLDSSAYQLDTPDFTSQGQFKLTLTPAQSPYLDMRAQLKRGRLETIRTYLPTKIMSAKLVNWLNRALHSGDIVQSDLVIKGPLDSFPYSTQRQGIFHVKTHIQDGRLAYHPAWPPLHIERLQLIFNQQSMLADLQSGQLLDSTVKTQAKIAPLGQQKPLELTIAADGPVQDIVTLLQTPTLTDSLRATTAHLQTTGTAQTQIQISLPLKADTQTTQVNGHIQLTDATLQLPKITLKQVTGMLNIRDNRLHAEAVPVNIRGQSGQISVEPTTDETDGTEHTLIRLDTRLTPANITQWVPQIPHTLLRGSAAAQVSLSLHKQNNGPPLFSQLQVKSDLAGLQIKLPAPVGKARYTERPLRLALSLGNNRKPHRLHYGRYWHGLFSHDWRRGTLRYATAQTRLPKTGYRLQGDFQHLDLNAWQQALQQLPPRKQHASAWQLDLSATQLQYPPYTLKQARLKARRTSSNIIRGEIQSPQLIGQAQYNPTQNRLNIYLEQAHIDWPRIAPTKHEKRPDPKPILPNNYPSLRLLCEDLRIDRIPFGQLYVQTELQQNHQIIKKIALQGNNLLVQANGAWQPDQTTLQGSYQAADLGTLLTQLGKPRHFKEADAQGTFDLRWLGHPFQVNTTNLTGKAGLIIGPGRLATVSPGFTRILGLVNVDAFTRRLKLDFADLFKTGYTFDRIQGNFVFGDGQVNTRDLYVDGPTSKIQIGGRIGLEKQDIEQLVYITPKLDGTLLLAGTLAGGPVGTLTSLLVQQLLRRQVDRFSRFEYSVTGTWQNPRIMPLESGGALSDFINSLRQKETQDTSPQQNNKIQPAPQRGALQRFIDIFRPTQESTEQGWTDEELLNID